MDNILIIEDDRSIAEIERDFLEAEGLSVHIEPNGRSGLEEALKGTYDLVLLDLMLPGLDGFTVCSEIRKALDIPVLMITARLDDADKIRGLGLGADDYIEKPFSPSVLTARVRAHLSRYRRLKSGPENDSTIITCGDITVNTATREVTAYGKPAELKNKEYELLLFFINNRDIVLSRETLYDRIWGLDAIGDSITVAVHINRLREKLEENPAEPKYIQTIRGAGYRFHCGIS